MTKDTRLIEYINTYNNLAVLPADKLVELVLKEMDDMYLDTNQELMIEELCSRVDPGWTKR